MTDKMKLARALVKPLVWERKYSNDWRGEIYKIDTAGYRRTIVPQNTIGGGFHLLASFDSDIKGDFPTLEAAKAAAEADYIARMAAALNLDAVVALEQADDLTIADIGVITEELEARFDKPVETWDGADLEKRAAAMIWRLAVSNAHLVAANRELARQLAAEKDRTRSLTEANARLQAAIAETRAPSRGTGAYQ